MVSYVTLDNCAGVRGTVVVIDVLRAFTTATYALDAGARDVLLVGGVEEAFALRRDRFPDALLMGEVDGLPIPGFDLSNSPAEVAGVDLTGRRLIHRTTAGTQGVVRSTAADTVLAASFACAGATVEFLRSAGTGDVTFVVTGADALRDGEEDRACAEFLAARLAGDNPDPAPYLARVAASTSGRLFTDPKRPDFPAEDLDLAIRVDTFSHPLLVRWVDGHATLRGI